MDNLPNELFLRIIKHIHIVDLSKLMFISKRMYYFVRYNITRLPLTLIAIKLMDNTGPFGLRSYPKSYLYIGTFSKEKILNDLGYGKYGYNCDKYIIKIMVAYMKLTFSEPINDDELHIKSLLENNLIFGFGVYHNMLIYLKDNKTKNKINFFKDDDYGFHIQQTEVIINQGKLKNRDKSFHLSNINQSNFTLNFHGDVSIFKVYKVFLLELIIELFNMYQILNNINYNGVYS